VISEYGDGVLGAFEIVPPMLHGRDNRKHLTVVDVVIAFSGVGLSRPESDRVEEFILAILAKDTRTGESGGVRIQVNRELWVEVMQNGGFCYKPVKRLRVRVKHALLLKLKPGGRAPYILEIPKPTND